MKRLSRLKQLGETWHALLVAAVAIPVFYFGYEVILPGWPEGLLGWVLLVPFLPIMVVSGIITSAATLWLIANSILFVCPSQIRALPENPSLDTGYDHE